MIKSLFLELNRMDYLIIWLIHAKEKEKLGVGELTALLKIKPVNLWKHIKKLEALGIVISPKVQRGKKKVLSLNNDDKTKVVLEYVKSINDLTPLMV